MPLQKSCKVGCKSGETSKIKKDGSVLRRLMLLDPLRLSWWGFVQWVIWWVKYIAKIAKNYENQLIGSNLQTKTKWTLFIETPCRSKSVFEWLVQGWSLTCGNFTMQCFLAVWCHWQHLHLLFLTVNVRTAVAQGMIRRTLVAVDTTSLSSTCSCSNWWPTLITVSTVTNSGGSTLGRGPCAPRFTCCPRFKS